MSPEVKAEELNRLRDRCRSMRNAVHRVVAECLDRELVTELEIRQFRLVLKKNKALRQADDPAAVKEAINTYDEFLESYCDRLREDGGELPALELSEATTDSSDRSEEDRRDLQGGPSSGSTHHDDSSSIGRHGTGTVTAGSDAPGMRPAGRAAGDDPLLHELTEDQLEEFGLRYQLVQRMERGASAREAVEESELDYGRRWATKIYNRYREEGLPGLMKKSWSRKPKRRVLTRAVRHLIQAWRQKLPHAPVVAIHENVKKACEEAGWSAPSYECVRQYLKKLPKATRLMLSGGAEAWDKEARPTVRLQDRATYGNQVWEVDETSLPVWCRVEVRDVGWVPIRPHLVAGIDVYSQALTGLVLTPHAATADTTLQWLRQSIQEKERRGWSTRFLPQTVVTDHGSIFKAKTVEAAFAQLGIQHELTPPDWPQGKPYIERFFDTLDTSYLRREVPSHTALIGKSAGAAKKKMKRLPTISMLRESMRDWVAETYHQQNHTDAERTRQARWEQTVRRRQPAEEQIQALLHRTEDTRVVQRTGVQLTVDGERHRYWAPELVERFKDEVWLRYSPEELVSVLVYSADTNDFLCEAYDLDHPDAKYSTEDIKEERRQYRRAAKKRRKKLEEQTTDLALEQRAKAEWGRAHEVADKVENAAAQRESVDDNSGLAAQMEEADRADEPAEVTTNEDDLGDEPSLADLRDLRDRSEL